MKENSAFLKYLAALLLFGSNGVVASHILLPSHEIVFFRTLIGSAFLLLLFIMTKGRPQIPINKKHFAYLLLSGAAMGACWLVLFKAYTMVGVGISTLIYYCGPVIVMALSPILFHEKLSAFKILGMSVVLVGMVLINGGSLVENGFSKGLIYAILSAVLYAVLVISSKKARSITGLENSMYQLAGSFLTVAVFVFVKQGLHFGSISESLLPILLIGVINTGLGCYLYFSSIQHLSVGTVSVCGYLEPLSAVIFSVILLGESLSLLQTIGGGLIIGGAVFAESAGRWKHLRSSPDADTCKQTDVGTGHFSNQSNQTASCLPLKAPR